MILRRDMKDILGALGVAFAALLAFIRQELAFVVCGQPCLEVGPNEWIPDGFTSEVQIHDGSGKKVG